MSEKTYSLELTIRTLLGNKRYSSIKDILITLNAADIAAIFAELEPEILPLLFRLLPKELAADTFVEMDPDQQQPEQQGQDLRLQFSKDSRDIRGVQGNEDVFDRGVPLVA